MKGYRILYVEDEWQSIKETCETAFPELGTSGELNMARSEVDIKRVLKKIQYLDIANDFKEALRLLSLNAEKYLLFIVDRDLGERPKRFEQSENGQIEESKYFREIKKIWGSISIQKYDDKNYRSGDLLLEYLSLNLNFKKEDIIERFRFFTSYPDLESGIEIFLEALHYDVEERKALILHKSNEKDDNALMGIVNRFPERHIQHKHSDVFNALKENAQDFPFDQSEHIPNMIIALAYAEGIRPNGAEPKEPSVTLLRALGEAFRKKISEIATTQYLVSPQKESDLLFAACEEKINAYEDGASPFFELSLNAITAFHSKMNQKGFNPFDIEKLNPLELFSPPMEKYKLNKAAQGRILKYREKYSHIANCMSLVQTISSQDMHHNDQKHPPGKRLQLVTYALCELLLFYTDKIKGKSIVSDD